MLHRACALLLATMLSFGSSGPVTAQGMDLPAEVQVPIFLKLLTFDRNLSTGPGTELVIALVYQGGNRESAAVRRSVEAELKKAAAMFEGLTTRVVPIDLEEERDLSRRLMAEGVQAMYIAPLRAMDIRDLLRVTRPIQVRTFSGVTRFVNQGVALGATVRGDLPQILLNLPAALEEGADYPAQIRKLARVIE